MCREASQEDRMKAGTFVKCLLPVRCVALYCNSDVQRREIVLIFSCL